MVDAQVVAELEEAGIDVTLEQSLPHLGIEIDDDERVRPLEGKVLVAGGDATAHVELKPISELFAGNAVPPDMSGHYPEAYVPLFATIELTVVDYCFARGLLEHDREVERVYRRLRKRPDGRDANPLFGYVRAAVRLYMSLRETSRAELCAVLKRLARSARTYSIGRTSTNYVEAVAGMFHGDPDAVSAPVRRAEALLESHRANREQWLQRSGL